jgi:hypothetical protein
MKKILTILFLIFLAASCRSTGDYSSSSSLPIQYYGVSDGNKSYTISVMPLPGLGYGISGGGKSYYITKMP